MNSSRQAYQPRYRHWAEALAAALVEDDFYITLKATVARAGHDDPELALVHYLDYSMLEAERYGRLHFPPDHAYGVCVWSTPVTAEVASERARYKKDFLLNHLGADYTAVYSNVVEFMSAQSDARIAADDWYLSIVGILPEFQNRGFGGALLCNALAETDRLGVATYLETFTPRNEAFYERLGYRVTARFEEPTIGASYALMHRPCAAT